MKLGYAQIVVNMEHSGYFTICRSKILACIKQHHQEKKPDDAKKIFLFLCYFFMNQYCPKKSPFKGIRSKQTTHKFNIFLIWFTVAYLYHLFYICSCNIS